MHLACEVMEIDARQSIYYAAENAFGKNAIHTNMYNVYRRVETLVNKMIANKKISLEATFLPKRKRVLNKKHTRVLNKPVKRAKAKKKEVDAVLDSQVSISCLLDSQTSQPPSSPSLNSPVSRMHTHTHYEHTHAFLLHTHTFTILGQWACISSAFAESEFAGLCSDVTKLFTKF